MGDLMSEADYSSYLFCRACLGCGWENKYKQRCDQYKTRYFETDDPEKPGSKMGFCRGWVGEQDLLDRLLKLKNRGIYDNWQGQVMRRLYSQGCTDTGVWTEVYKAEVKREGMCKKGGGEKNDRTHKIFSEARMRDNRGKFGFEGWKGFGRG